jgi:hypothetical protein
LCSGLKIVCPFFLSALVIILSVRPRFTAHHYPLVTIMCSPISEAFTPVFRWGPCC